MQAGGGGGESASGLALGPTFPWRLTLPSSASGSGSLRAPRPAQGSTGQHRAGAAAGAPSGLGGGAPESPSRFLLFLGLFQGSASFLPLCSFKTLSLSVSGGPQKLALSRNESQATTCCEEGRERDLLGFPPQSWETNEGDDVVNGILSGQVSVSTTTSLVLDTGNTQCSLRSHLRWSVGE